MALPPRLDVRTPDGQRLRNVQPVVRVDGTVTLLGKARAQWPGETTPTDDARVVVVATAPGPLEVTGERLGRAWTLGDGWSAVKAGGCGCGGAVTTNVARQLDGT